MAISKIPGVMVSRNIVLLQDQKPQNTQGGTFTSGAWRTRDLNTKVADTGSICTLSSNQFILPAGTYLIHASAPSWVTDFNQLRIQNITDGTTVCVGQTSDAIYTVSYVNQVCAYLVGYFTISGTKTLELQHRCQYTRANDGFGVACGFGTEVYAIVEIEQLA